MRITEKGKYQLLEDIKVRNSCTIGTLPKGAIISITSIDDAYHKVIGPELLDWMYWELPVEKLPEEVRTDGHIRI